MTTRHIVVLPYDEKWKQAFLDIKSELAQALGSLALSIEHVGSTSVPGLAAKPIIDIDVVVRKTDVEAAIRALATICYEHEGNGGIEGREMFKYYPHCRSHKSLPQTLARHIQSNHPIQKLFYNELTSLNNGNGLRKQKTNPTPCRQGHQPYFL